MEAVVPYEQRLNANPRWALLEGSMHFEKESKVHDSLRRNTTRLDDLGVPYALVGGMAMFLHGYRRFNGGVDVLVTKESVALIHEKLEGSGDLPPPGAAVKPGSAGDRSRETPGAAVKQRFAATGREGQERRP
jgi:hypothetical protein